MGNQIRTTVLLAVMTAGIVWVGQLLGGRQGMWIALVLAAGMNGFSYWFSDKIVLRMYRAREVSAQEQPQLHRTVATLAANAGLPMPTLFLIADAAPNAFATGRNPEHAVVAVTQGLLDMMTPQEVAGVVAHELTHVKNRDILIGSIAATMAGAIMILASMARWSAFLGGVRGNDREGGSAGALGLIVMSLMAPLAAMVIQMAISRSREYLADAGGAAICGHPEWLARALEKLGAHSGRLPQRASPSTAHMLIVNPLSGRGVLSLFATHPPLEDRIARLRGRAGSGTPPPETGGRTAREAARRTWEQLSK
jgi:heat shock protein HtpX